MSADRAPHPHPTLTGRLASLDQFRGYTVLGMILVNFLGRYDAVPPILKHHNTYCSYADTIMPQFLMAVGFAYRLTYLKRRQREGTRAAVGHAIERNLGLIVLGLILYGLDGQARTWSELRELGLGGFLATAFQRDPFQTLVHIGVTSLWVLPVIGRGVPARLAYLVGSGLLHLALSAAFYFDFAWNRPVIDGGPLGFLTWTIPLLVGSLAYDALVVLGLRRGLNAITVLAVFLMAVGYGISCLGPAGIAAPPFVPPDRPVDLWTMSQRTGSLSYLIFSAGFSLVVYALFVAACDLGRLGLGIFRTFGTNALVAYVMHPLVSTFVRPYLPPDAPAWYVAAGTALYVLLCYAIVRHLERQNIFIKM